MNEPANRESVSAEGTRPVSSRSIGEVAGEHFDVLLDALAVTSRLSRIPEYARRFDAALANKDYQAIQRLLVEAGVINRFVIEELSRSKITIEYHNPKCHTIKVTYEV